MRLFTLEEEEKIKVLTANSVELGYLEPTANGLSKSIMDATGPLRTYLKSVGIHDFSLQSQGQESKKFVDAYHVIAGKIIPAKVSLYRPNTKKGDPRIWITKLNEYVKPNEILGLITHQNVIYIINISSLDVRFLINGGINNPLKELVEKINGDANRVANELLNLLRKIAIKPVKALLNADTAVGRTLETLLGIDINSSQLPDYKGIELKSFRAGKGNRKNLFAQVPDWKISKFKSSSEILDNFGYTADDVFRLYCTVTSTSFNPNTLRLKLKEELGQLMEYSSKAEIGDFVVWQLETLHKRLLEKHNETFWISAETFYEDGNEYFHYNKVEHTKKPITTQFDVLLQQGIITLDHLIKRSENGKVVEKGPIFKIRPNSLSLLFPPSKSYNLLTNN